MGGSAGRNGEALVANDVSIVVVEDNREIVERLRQKNVPAVFDNASEPGILIQAHIHKASMLVIATPDSAEARRPGTAVPTVLKRTWLVRARHLTPVITT
jgi:monovalent cation:H+ antiporter-2, CPA2 family